MANEVQIIGRLDFSLGSLEFAHAQAVMAAADPNSYLQGRVTSASGAATAFPSIPAGTLKWCIVKNLSTTAAEIVHLQTNEIATTSANGRFASLPAEALAIFPILSGATLWHRSAQGTPTLEFIFLT